LHFIRVISFLKFSIPKTSSKQGRKYTTVPIHAPGETENGKSNQPFKGIMPPVGRHWRTDVVTLEKWDKAGLIEWSSTGNPRKIIFADEKEGKRVVAVAHSFKIFRIAFYSCNIVSKIFNTKNLIHHYFNIMSNFVINMQINRPLRTQRKIHPKRY
jgi:hypothetical protein